MIRPAKQKDLLSILDITKACTVDMISKEIYQWNEHYPNKVVFQKDLNRKELYVLEVGEKLMGAIVISDFMDLIYKPIKWKSPTNKNIYIHRLCVHPIEQGKGYAQELMNFAEQKAVAEGFSSVRLDTFSLNKRNLVFYIKRGYTQLADIYFPMKSSAPFRCFELPSKPV